jgi:hypothetical protein
LQGLIVRRCSPLTSLALVPDGLGYSAGQSNPATFSKLSK